MILRKKKSDNMIRLLIQQLSTRLAKKSKELEVLFCSCDDGNRQPGVRGLMKVLKDILAGRGKVYIIVDALDKCSDIKEMLEKIEEIHTWSLSQLHLLVTSRRLADLEDGLEPITSPQARICIQSALVNTDILVFIREQLRNDGKLQSGGRSHRY
jgi:hypothetical protein